MPSDYSKALAGNRSKSNQDFVGTLEVLIEPAEHCVDPAVYDLEHPRIGQILTAAKKRGVHVHIVY